LNNLLIDSAGDLQNAIEYLRKNDLGKASFYLLRSNEKTKKSFIESLSTFNHNRKAKKLAKEKSFIGWAKDFVETERSWQPYFEQALFNYVVTADLKSAIELNRKISCV